MRRVRSSWGLQHSHYGSIYDRVNARLVKHVFHQDLDTCYHRKYVKGRHMTSTISNRTLGTRASQFLLAFSPGYDSLMSSLSLGIHPKPLQ